MENCQKAFSFLDLLHWWNKELFSIAIKWELYTLIYTSFKENTNIKSWLTSAQSPLLSLSLSLSHTHTHTRTHTTHSLSLSMRLCLRDTVRGELRVSNSLISNLSTSLIGLWYSCTIGKEEQLYLPKYWYFIFRSSKEAQITFPLK